MRLHARRCLCRLVTMVAILCTLPVVLALLDWMSGSPPVDGAIINDHVLGDELPNHYIPSTSMARDNGPVMVVMVTYQRSGSSFLGEIFNQNPAAFEWFEPLDGLYSAMYGTEYGYNVPADIWNFWNGTLRILPEYEMEALARVTADILTCNFTDLPTEILFHHFMEMFAMEHQRMKPYVSCAQEKFQGKVKHGRTLTSCRMCNVRLSKVCGQRFGQKVDSQLQCAQLLLPHLFPGRHWRSESGLPAPAVRDARIVGAVNTYLKCMTPCRIRAMRCLPRLTSVCESSPLRALKPVRLPMRAVDKLLDYLPQVKIIHNLRDPRGVAISRHNTSRSFQAVYAGASLTKNPKTSTHDIVKEAQLFCRNAHADSKIYETLKSAHPRNLIRVIYENYAMRPVDTAVDVYKFLGLDVPDRVMAWLTENTKYKKKHRQTTRNSTETSSRWQRVITGDERHVISRICRDLIVMMGDVWPTI